MVCVSESTTVRVSRSTLGMSKRLRDKLEVGSLAEAIQVLVMRQRGTMIDEAFGLDKWRVKPFAEEDRGKDRG